ncbi:MAG: hypothetical protein K6E51_04290 [Treponema sp.]|nr:hypothetical protein [Treponema sp.]
MKKIVLFLEIVMVFLCVAYSNTNKESQKEYTLTAKTYFRDTEAEFMGRAMHFSYQEYSGFKNPVLTHDAVGFLRKNVWNSLRFVNISSKLITEAEIYFRVSGNSEGKKLQVTFDDFDFVPGSNCTVVLKDSFLMDDEFRLDKITFRYDDASEQTVSAGDLRKDWILSPLDLTGSGLFFITDSGTGTYYFTVKTYSPDSEFTGSYKITGTKKNDEKITIEGSIRYCSEEDVFSANVWEELALEQLCDLKKLEIEFSANGKTVTKEVTDSLQLDKITMWISAFCYYGYR